MSEDTYEAPSFVPKFDGQDVTHTKAKLASVSGLDINDEVLRMDQLVQMTVVGRVTRVDHVVDNAGRIVRVQTIKILDGYTTELDDSVAGLADA